MHDLLDTSARVNPDAVAVSDKYHQWTYAKLHDYSFRFASWLGSQGVRPGDRVVYQIKDQAMAVVALFATSRVHATFVPLSIETRPYLLEHLIRDADPRLVIVEERDVLPVRRFTATPAVAVPGVIDLDRAAPFVWAEDGQESPAFLLYTSGSTDIPKAIVCPHHNVIFAATAISKKLGYEPTDIVYLRVPLSFDYGLYQPLLTTLSGAKLMIAADRSTAALLREVRDGAVTVVPVVPSLARTLIMLRERDRAPTHVRLFTNTGEAMPAATISALRHGFAGSKVILMYGTTECKRIAIAEPDLDLVRPGSVGKPICGTRVTVVDEDRRSLGPGEIGEIVTSGPHVMDGYWRAPGQSARVFGHDNVGTPVLYTGDEGCLDSAGYLYVYGRRRSWFKRRGQRVSISEVERAALDIPGVSAAAAIAPESDGKFFLFVLSDDSAPQIAKELAQRLEPAKVPDRCVRIDVLPVTANGKVDRSALHKRAVSEDPL